MSPEKIKAFRDAARRHYKAEDHHVHKRPGKSMSDAPLNVKKEMLADWYSVSKRTSSKKEYPDIKQWVKDRGYEDMLKESMLKGKAEIVEKYLSAASQQGHKTKKLKES